MISPPPSSLSPAPRRRWATRPFVLAVRAYQIVLGPILGGRCRFYPSCSDYALDAYHAHGPLRGTWLTLRRLLRCHPFGGSGVDLVPPAPTLQPNSKPPRPRTDR